MKAFKGPLAVLLCCTLAGPAPLGFAQEAQAPADRPAAQTKTRPPYKSTQLNGDERIEHALNRLTFGPKPGDWMPCAPWGSIAGSKASFILRRLTRLI